MIEIDAGDAAPASAAFLGAAFAVAGVGAAARGGERMAAVGAGMAFLGAIALTVATGGSKLNMVTRYLAAVACIAGGAFLSSPFTGSASRRAGFALAITAPCLFAFAGAAYVAWLYSAPLGQGIALRLDQASDSFSRDLASPRELARAAAPSAPIIVTSILGGLSRRGRALAALAPIAFVATLTSASIVTLAASLGAGIAWALFAPRLRLALGLVAIAAATSAIPR